MNCRIERLTFIMSFDYSASRVCLVSFRFFLYNFHWNAYERLEQRIFSSSNWCIMFDDHDVDDDEVKLNPRIFFLCLLFAFTTLYFYICSNIINVGAERHKKNIHICRVVQTIAGWRLIVAFQWIVYNAIYPLSLFLWTEKKKQNNKTRAHKEIDDYDYPLVLFAVSKSRSTSNAHT